jgi:hypothetical protein
MERNEMKETLKLKLLIGWYPMTIVIGAGILVSFLKRIPISSTDYLVFTFSADPIALPSILQAVSIIFGIIFVGFFYFRDKSMQHLKLSLDLLRVSEDLKSKEISIELKDSIEILTKEVLPSIKSTTETMIEFTQIFFKYEFVIFSIAIILCIIGIVEGSASLATFISIYVISFVAFFTVGFYMIWSISDKSNKTALRLLEIVDRLGSKYNLR